jgi:hypothetical protein
MGDVNEYTQRLYELISPDDANPSFEQLQALIVKGADVNYEYNFDEDDDEPGQTLLIAATHRGYLGAVKALVSSDDILVNATCRVYGSSNTALEIASYSSEHNNVEIMKLLLAAKGIDINHQDEEGYTALMATVPNFDRNDMDLMKLLLEDARTNIHLKCGGETAIETLLAGRRREPRDDFDKAIALFKGETLL